MTRRSTVTAGVCFVVFVFMLAARERVVTTWAVHTPVGRNQADANVGVVRYTV